MVCVSLDLSAAVSGCPSPPVRPPKSRGEKYKRRMEMAWESPESLTDGCNVSSTYPRTLTRLLRSSCGCLLPPLRSSELLQRIAPANGWIDPLMDGCLAEPYWGGLAPGCLSAGRPLLSSPAPLVPLSPQKFNRPPTLHLIIGHHCHCCL